MADTPPSFIPREKGVLPRILLLDFDGDTAQFLTDSGYSVSQGHSGFGAMPFILPKHESEVEIVLWDMTHLRNDQQLLLAGGAHHTGSPEGRRLVGQVSTALEKYCARMREKGGFFGVLLGDTQASEANGILDDVLDKRFSFFSRRTTTLNLEPRREEKGWYEFFRRFIAESDIHYGIEWNDNLIGLVSYFSDEDDNWYAAYFHHLALIPKIADGRKQEALSFLLQDVLPSVCDGEDIFPDKYYYRWANKTEYLPPRVQELKADNERIAAEATAQTTANNEEIVAEMTADEYLTNILIADDSNLFPEEKKLSASLHKVLEGDLGFTVTDVDAMRLEVGESLKEDKWIEDTDGFFALVEIKGTEKGAKANWVRQDLNAHIREFEVVKGVTNLNSILIFNHERRADPAERSTPFASDADLLEYCKKSRICLVPVHELFKMVRAMRRGALSQEDARALLKTTVGLFAYTE